MPRRVLVLSAAAPPKVGGSESLTHVLVTGLAEQGCGVDLVTPEAPHAPLLEAIAASGGEAVQLAVPDRELSSWEDECFYRSEWLHARLERGDVDVVHVMSQDTAIAAAIALADRAPGERPALVAMFSEIGTQEVPYGRARARFAYRLPQVAMHAALSRRYAEVALGHGVPEERVRLTYGGIDLDRARSGSRARSRAALELGDDDVLVACPSRFTVRKGQMDLLEGFELAHASEPRLRLALAGTAHSGSEEFRRRIEDEIAARGLGSVARVVLDAHYDRLPDVLAAADVVAQPSHFEGLGFSALEAMAAERPVLLTRVPGFVEFARHGENAWVAPGHDPQALAEGLLALARDPDLRQRLVAEGVRTAEEFSAERFVSRVLDVYDECLQPAPA